jgi:TATA-box binding protein (TBP) (component of TFIID and TFIIIB)
MDIDAEWEIFVSNGGDHTDLQSIDALVNKENECISTDTVCPKASDIYISTKSKIAYLNKPIDLNTVFWKLPIIRYTTPKNGIVKKQMKFNSSSQKEVDAIKECLDKEYYYSEQILTSVNSPSGAKDWFKDVRKISIGMSQKDILSYRSKQKCAFYNCFVIILRILMNDNDNNVDPIFKEFHVKIFNTGKVEIPGIRTDEQLNSVLENILIYLRPIVCSDLDYNGECDTVLINSNFSCGFFINREVLFDILTKNYNIQCIYDPCSYPGIQCKFYYDKSKPSSEQSGIRQHTDLSGSGTIVVSFMIFRTGSILIVGMCNEDILEQVYIFIKNVLETEFLKICQKLCSESDLKAKTKKTKLRKKTIYIDVSSNENNDENIENEIIQPMYDDSNVNSRKVLKNKSKNKINNNVVTDVLPSCI